MFAPTPICRSTPVGNVARTRETAVVLAIALAMGAWMPRGLAAPEQEITHGPMLGAVAEDAAALWLRTAVPGPVTVAVRAAEPDAAALVEEVRTSPDRDNTAIVRFAGLRPDTRYDYDVRAGAACFAGSFRTFGPAWRDRPIRIEFGSCYKQKFNRMPVGDSVFARMAARAPDCVIFLGDFPYTDAGRRSELAAGHNELRGIVGFRSLTSATPCFGIFDDHDFGPNDCDGTHPHAAEALAAFKDYWPNPSYGDPDSPGIFTSFVIGTVEVFLLDGRSQARQAAGTMLGKAQFDWLCRRLAASPCRFKVLASGSPFALEKIDCWAGPAYARERDALFAFIRDHGVTGVLGISGDAHRSDIHAIAIGGGRLFHDFTAGALCRDPTPPPDAAARPASMIHSYGRSGDNNMFGELDFHPAGRSGPAVVYRSMSAANGVIHEHVLSPADLGLGSDGDAGR